jgi:hypothetical protein
MESLRQAGMFACHRSSNAIALFIAQSSLPPKSLRCAFFNRPIDLFKGYGLGWFWNHAFEPGGWNPGQNDDAVRVEEELEAVPRFDLQAIPNCFGDCHLAFAAEHRFHGERFSSLYILANVKRPSLNS